MVKTIGDEVMFVSELPERRRLRSRCGSPSGPATTRCCRTPAAGLAYGPVVAREGDYYGPVVNLAHRLVEVAYPGTVLASDELHEAIAEDPAFQLGPAPRTARSVTSGGSRPGRCGPGMVTEAAVALTGT